MGYEDFVWFILSEEDKTSDTSLEYWFRCCDLDGDGKLTASELLVGGGVCGWVGGWVWVGCVCGGGGDRVSPTGVEAGGKGCICSLAA